MKGKDNTLLYRVIPNSKTKKMSLLFGKKTLSQTNHFFFQKLTPLASSFNTGKVEEFF